MLIYNMMYCRRIPTINQKEADPVMKAEQIQELGQD